MELKSIEHQTNNATGDMDSRDYLRQFRASKGQYLPSRRSYVENSEETEVEENSSNFSLRGSRGGFSKIDNQINNTATESHYDERFNFDPSCPSSSAYNEPVVKRTLEYKYIGETLFDKRHGYGICFYNTGDVYNGQWENDKKEGNGKLTTRSGKTFIGEFANDTIDGFCEYINARGIRHQGLMKNYKFITKEPLLIKNNKCYFQGIMDFQSGKLMGVGKITYINGNVYEGETYDYQEFGWGILKRRDNFVFKGEKNHEGFNGYCEIYYPDKSKFFGWFVNNKREGLGISLSKEGVYAIGTYANDIKNGGCLLCCKGVCKFELWLFGFLCKTVDKKESIIAYIDKVYPEYRYLYQANNKQLYNSLFIDNVE